LRKVVSQPWFGIAVVLVIYAGLKAAYVTNIIGPYWSLVIDQGLIMTIAALGLNLIYGFTGQFSLGHAAFYGIGAYTAGLLSKLVFHGSYWGFLVSLLAGAAMSGIVSFLLGLPILRLKSDYLGIATLGFVMIVKTALDNTDLFLPAAGGARGLTGVPQLAGFDIVYLVLILTVVLLRNIVFSTHGRAMIAVREDELAADAVGVNTTAYKTIAFTIGGALAGLAGGLYAARYPLLHPSMFNFLHTFDFLLVVVLGGLGSITGTLVASMAWVFILEGLRAVLPQALIDWRGVLYAVILIVLMILRPQGLMGNMEFPFLVPKRRVATAQAEVSKGAVTADH